MNDAPVAPPVDAPQANCLLSGVGPGELFRYECGASRSIPFRPHRLFGRHVNVPLCKGICKLGYFRPLSTLSRPDIRGRLARLVSHVNLFPGSDVFRINDLAEIVNQ